MELDPLGGARYRLLETLRQYGANQLQDEGAEDAARARLAAWCLELAEQASEQLWGPEQPAWLDRLDAEYENLRAALDWCEESPAGTATGLRIAASLWFYWDIRGYLHENLARLQRILERPDVFKTPDCMAAALDAAGWLVFLLGQPSTALTYFRRAQQMWAELPAGTSSANLARSLAFEGLVILQSGDADQAERLFNKGLDLAQTAGEIRWAGWSIYGLGHVAWLRSELGTARELEVYPKPVDRGRGRSAAYAPGC